MTTENKVEFGLSNVKIAMLHDDGNKLTYDTPFALNGAVELSLDPEGDTSPFYADNGSFYTSTTNNGYSGKLTVARITDEFRQRVLNEKVDEFGTQAEFSKASSNPFAMMFEFEGDKNSVRHVLYHVTVKRPSVTGKTKEDKTDVQTAELELTAIPDKYTDIPKSKNSNQDSEVYKNWFNKVQTFNPAQSENTDNK